MPTSDDYEGAAARMRRERASQGLNEVSPELVSRIMRAVKGGERE
jgi:hypothetical protein